MTGLGGSYDKGASARPNLYRQRLTDEELTALVRDCGIARRIVELPAREIVRAGWDLVDDSPDTDVLADVPVWQSMPATILEGVTWARTYGSAVGLLVTDERGAGDPGWLAAPLDLRRVRALRAVQVFDAVEATPTRWDSNVGSPNFRLPSEWRLTPSVMGGDYGYSRVHASRVVVFRGVRRPPNVRMQWGVNRGIDDSVLQVGWDSIRNLLTTMQGGATMAQELREAIVKIAGLENMSASDQRAEISAHMQELAAAKGLLGILLLAEGDTYENRSNPPTGFAELAEGARTMLAAEFGIPQTLLFGETPGGLNTDGESSRQNWDRTVGGVWADVEPILSRVAEVIFASSDGPAEPDAWKIEMGPLDEPSEKDEAETRKTRAETDAIYFDLGVLTTEHIAASRFGADGYQAELLPVDLADIEEVEPAPEADLALLDPARQLPGPAGSGSGGGAQGAQDRADSTDSTAILAYLSDAVTARLAALRAEVETITGPLTPPGPPHVTVLYLGDVDASAISEIAEAMGGLAGRAGAVRTRPRGVAAFPHGDDGTPIVLALDWAWGLESLHGRLLRRLAHLVVARQHDEFRPHVTIGYLPRALTGPEAAALLEVECDDAPIAVAELALCHGRDHVVARALLAGVADVADTEPENAP